MRLRPGLLALFGGLLAGLYEATVWGFAPVIASGIHPIAPGIALFVLYEQPEAALVFAGVAGLVTDVLSVDAPYFLLAAYLLIAFGLGLMAKTVFTNRSLYAAIALCLVARACENLWVLGVDVLRRASWNAGASWFSATPWWAVPASDILIMSGAFFVSLLVRRTMRGAGETRRAMRTYWYG